MKLYLLILIFSSITFADASFTPNDKMEKHSKYVYSIWSFYEDVNVYSGKYTVKSECKIKIDIKKGLLNTNRCDVKEITLFNSDTLFLGNILNFENSSFQRFHSYVGLNTDGIDVDDVAFVLVNFDFARQYEPNAKNVKCDNPKAKVVYDETDSAFICYVPWKCDSWPKRFSYYSVDEQECRILPPHGIRNIKSGFHCEKGYVVVGDSCMKKVSCGKNERYFESSNLCGILPKNAHWNENAKDPSDFKCDEGFVELPNSGCGKLDEN